MCRASTGPQRGAGGRARTPGPTRSPTASPLQTELGAGQRLTTRTPWLPAALTEAANRTNLGPGGGIQQPRGQVSVWGLSFPRDTSLLAAGRKEMVVRGAWHRTSTTQPWVARPPPGRSRRPTSLTPRTGVWGAHPPVGLALPPALVPADAAVDLDHVALPQRELPHVPRSEVVPGHSRADDPGGKHCWGQGAVTQLQGPRVQPGLGGPRAELGLPHPVPGLVPRRALEGHAGLAQGSRSSVGLGTGTPKSSQEQRVGATTTWPGSRPGQQDTPGQGRDPVWAGSRAHTNLVTLHTSSARDPAN